MSSIDYIKVGKKVKSLRNNAGLTQEVMAEKCNISTSYLGHIERGSRKLSLETAVKIADCLNASLDGLILDAKVVGESILPSIEAVVQKQDTAKQEQFLRLLKVLADNMEHL